MRRCHWCPEDAPAAAADLTAVRWFDSGSGPGVALYACPPHTEEHGLAPLRPPRAAGLAHASSSAPRSAAPPAPAPAPARRCGPCRTTP
jgi:hypothetical protein